MLLDLDDAASAPTVVGDHIAKGIVLIKVERKAVGRVIGRNVVDDGS